MEMGTFVLLLLSRASEVLGVGGADHSHPEPKASYRQASSDQQGDIYFSRNTSESVLRKLKEKVDIYIIM